MKFISERMKSATHVVTVGQRPTARRPWFYPNQRWMKRIALGMLVVLGAEVFVVATPTLNNILAPLQNHLESQSHPYTPTQDQAPQHLEFQGERAWKNQDWGVSATAFAAYAQKTQDLQIAGWALRAAAQSQDQVLIEKTGAVYNQILAPLHLGANTTPWTHLSSVQSHLEKALAWSETHHQPLNDAALATYVALIQKNPGFATFLGLSLNDETLTETLTSKQGQTTLKAWDSAYASWLLRAPTLIEKRALDKQAQTFEQQGDLLSFEDLALSNPKIALSSIDSPESIFIQHYQKAGFTPQQISDLWREKIMLGSSDTEVFNPHLIRTKEETIAVTMRTLARSWLSEVKTPADLKSYYEKWDVAHNPNPTLLQFKALLDISSVNDTEYFEFLMGGSESIHWMNWPSRFDGEVGLEKMSDDQTTDSDLPLDTHGLRKELALYITHLPDSADKAPALSLQEAQASLQKAIQDAGLRSLHWPFYIAQTPDNLWKVSQYINHANEDLQAQTQWSGQVLGLKGRLDLSLSSILLDNSMGVTLQTDHLPGRLFINTVLSSRFNNWGPVAHEWLHFLDCTTKESTDPESKTTSPYSDIIPDEVKPLNWKGLGAQTQRWSKLWQDLRSPNIDTQAVLAEQQGRLFNVMVHHFPRFKLQISQEFEAIQSQTWTPELHHQLWKDARQKVLTQKENRFEYFTNQLKGFGENQSLKPSAVYGSSPFMRIANDASGGMRYWKRPTEVLARSFNEQLPDQSPLKGQYQIFLGTLSMNPTPTEIKAEKQSWASFFKAQHPWFQTLSSEIQPLTFKEAIQTRLQEKRATPPSPILPSKPLKS